MQVTCGIAKIVVRPQGRAVTAQPRARRAGLAAALAGFLILLFAGPAAAATLHVSSDGDDAGSGTISAPFRTVGKAASVARNGDTVLVASGTYHEWVTIPYSAGGVSFQGSGLTPPIIDGDGVRRYGFSNNAARGVTIEGFELYGQTDAGIYTLGTGARVIGNEIHDVGAPAVVHSNGIRIVQGSGAVVRDNVVRSIGPGSESMGIWLVQTAEASITGNEVYLVRKEGIRDWQGLNNSIESNRLFLNWAGVALNTATGSSVSNNFIYDNVIGASIKHTSYKTVLDYWNLPAAKWTTLRHNTIWRSSSSSIDIGSSDEPYDYVEIRDNIFDGAGYAYIHDIPSLGGENVVVDGNGYGNASSARYLYKAGWNSDQGIKGWDWYRTQTGFEAGGRQLDPLLSNPPAGDLDYERGSPAAAGSTMLDDALGSQLGARGLPPAKAIWTSYPMTAIASSSPGTYYTRVHLQDTHDDDQWSYWLSETNRDEYVVYDLGQPRTIDHAILNVFGHNDRRNIRGYRFEVSDDNVHWRTILEGTNPDSAGAAHNYAFPQPATGRYVRFTMLDTFCDSYEPATNCGAYFIFDDLELGTLAAAPVAESPSPPPSSPPNPTTSTPGPSTPSPSTPAPPAAHPSGGTTNPSPAARFGAKLIVPRQSLGSVLRRGSLEVEVHCSARCAISPRVRMDRRTADAARARGTSLVTSRAKRRSLIGGSPPIELKLKPAARRRLTRLRKAGLIVTATATGAGSPRGLELRRKVRLKR